MHQFMSIRVNLESKKQDKQKKRKFNLKSFFQNRQQQTDLVIYILIL